MCLLANEYQNVIVLFVVIIIQLIDKKGHLTRIRILLNLIIQTVCIPILHQINSEKSQHADFQF